jgi:hypothetical protein
MDQMGIFGKSGGNSSKSSGSKYEKSGSKGSYGKGYGKGSASSNERKYQPRTEAQARRDDRKFSWFK